jgi:hypothetical protein
LFNRARRLTGRELRHRDHPVGFDGLRERPLILLEWGAVEHAATFNARRRPEQSKDTDLDRPQAPFRRPP